MRSPEDLVPATRVALVGPGAVGSTVAALLYAAGQAVTLCGRTPRDAIEVRREDGEPIVIPGPVLTDPADIEEPVDVVLLAVKDTQNEQSAGWLARLCDERTVVGALQNGVEQVERVGRYCPNSTVVPAAVWVSAEPAPEGYVRLRTGARLVVPDTAGARTLADLFESSGVAVEIDPNFISAAWHKLLVNAVVGFMVLSGRRSGMFRRDDVAGLARQYLAECLAVARAEGAKLDDGVIDDIVGLLVKSPEDITTSMLTDREAGHQLEWDIRNGVIARKAAEHGLSTPISDVLVPLLAAASDGPG
ncbi:2-dehydropantoate 2-reductase [Mycolicibacterium sp. GF69]|uniref:oxidoreductase n=1 Tax=Mycolicibacterium sp. GF69 TaxID=2267251 RepID=UPI000DCD02C3|nr:oxidoreductase [Mycolicibacterium sp. GF69]RAV15662.1 2-dehydropantoate 2-reductase [Mycolicibacterium sp. GF69]